MKANCWEWVDQKSIEIEFFHQINEPNERNNDDHRQEDIKVIPWQGLHMGQRDDVEPHELEPEQLTSHKVSKLPVKWTDWYALEE